ncbi:MAG: amidohydrolase family protein, partial [Clostridia bacterium]|nr:amidohydrolase family protein [Clostridia bacterium]
GAQCPDFITEPREAEYRSLMEEFGKYIARWTYAPENDPEGAFARYLSEKGVLVSAGHTDAKYPDMVTAIENGCKLITHLYSCTSTITRDHGFRSLGVIESAYLRDELFVEIIADGKHLPADLLRLIVKLKGKERVALITDSLAIAGTDVTEGIMGATEFIVEDGVCKLKDRSAFAGSVATADRLVEVMVREAGFSLFDAVEMLTRIPAKILGLSKGQITPGYDADLVVMDDDFSVQTVFVAGKLV